MKRKYVPALILSTLIALIPLFVGLFLWDKLPAEVATSFGFNGEITGYSSKTFAVIGLPLIIIIANLICYFAILTDPRRNNIGKVAINAVLCIVPICSLFTGVLIYKDYIGLQINAGTCGAAFAGIVFFVIGLVLPKCKQNYTVGIRLPWTLNSEENWNKTHIFASKLWVFGGIIMAVLGFLGLEIVTFALIAVIITVPVIYSYIYYRKENHNN